jgi:hypothetical protein
MAKMLKEIEEKDSLENPHCVTAIEVELNIAELRQHMFDIKTSIEAMWKPLPTVEFKDRTVTTSDIAIID